MTYGYLDIAATPGVRAAQEANGSGEYWANFHGSRVSDRFTEAEAAFIAERDSFYMATVSESGWPYVQHRGGPPGFIRILDDRTLGVADFRGNRQYISAGNLASDDRAALILMDYPARRRLRSMRMSRSRIWPPIRSWPRSSSCRATRRRPSTDCSSVLPRSTGTARNISRRNSAKPNWPLRSPRCAPASKLSNPKTTRCAPTRRKRRLTLKPTARRSRAPPFSLGRRRRAISPPDEGFAPEAHCRDSTLPRRTLEADMV